MLIKMRRRCRNAVKWLERSTGKKQGSREAHLTTAVPWMSPRPGEDEVRSEVYIFLLTVCIHTYCTAVVFKDGNIRVNLL